VPCSAGGECTQERYQEGSDYPVRASSACFRILKSSDTVSRKVLTRILCNPDEDFTAPLLDVVNNSHLNVLHGGSGGAVCIWQDATKKSTSSVLLLREIINDGQELLADFIGTCCRDHFEQYILICTETTFCREYRSGWWQEDAPPPGHSRGSGACTLQRAACSPVGDLVQQPVHVSAGSHPFSASHVRATHGAFVSGDQGYGRGAYTAGFQAHHPRPSVTSTPS
jgi:hypothetical protein